MACQPYDGTVITTRQILERLQHAFILLQLILVILQIPKLVFLGKGGIKANEGYFCEMEDLSARISQVWMPFGGLEDAVKISRPVT